MGDQIWEIYPYLEKRPGYKRSVCRIEVYGGPSREAKGFVSCDGDRKDALVSFSVVENVSWHALQGLTEHAIDFILNEEEDEDFY